MMRRVSVFFAVAAFASLLGCTPEVGSEKWCTQLNEKPKGEWTANEAADYAKHCIFRKKN
jgi:hypothetical protein